jgi:hypothetical protein
LPRVTDRRQRRYRITRFAFGASVPVVLLLSFAQAANASVQDGSKAIHPRGKSCPLNETYSGISSTLTDLGNSAASAWTWAHNDNSKTATLSLSFSTTASTSYSVSNAAEVDASVILASAKDTVTVGLSYTHTEGETKTYGVSVPSGQYGYLGEDVEYYIFTGTYKIENTNCTETTYKNEVAKFPVSGVPSGFEGKSDKKLLTSPPWPLAPS